MRLPAEGDGGFVVQQREMGVLWFSRGRWGFCDCLGGSIVVLTQRSSFLLPLGVMNPMLQNSLSSLERHFMA
jgi:hypothetical protein